VGHLVGEATGRDELERLHLTEVRRVAEHVDEHELRNVAMAVRLVLVAEGVPQRRGLLGDDIPLLRCGLALPHLPDEVPAASRGAVDAPSAMIDRLQARNWPRASLDDPQRSPESSVLALTVQWCTQRRVQELLCLARLSHLRRCDMLGPAAGTTRESAQPPIDAVNKPYLFVPSTPQRSA